MFVCIKVNKMLCISLSVLMCVCVCVCVCYTTIVRLFPLPMDQSDIKTVAHVKHEAPEKPLLHQKMPLGKFTKNSEED